jgi:methylenetetrahydrofolate dehydrogenase (NADP+)/methenyltetrahydrofolate cyclohydrolase
MRPGQIVIDIGINYDEVRQKLCGDVDHEAAEQIVRAISAVPGGIGAVTSTILASHVVEAAENLTET